MAGKEKPNHDGKYMEYECECGETTEYGISRHKDSKQYDIDSCCGGCVAGSNVKYCPYCGRKIEVYTPV